MGIITQEFPPSCAQPRVPIHVFGVEVASHQDRHSPAETGGQVRSDQWAGRGEVSRKEFHRFACQCDLDGSSLQVVSRGMGTEWRAIQRRTRMALPPLLSVCLCGGRQLCKSEGLPHG